MSNSNFTGIWLRADGKSRPEVKVGMRFFTASNKSKPEKDAQWKDDKENENSPDYSLRSMTVAEQDKKRTEKMKQKIKDAQLLIKKLGWEPKEG